MNPNQGLLTNGLIQRIDVIENEINKIIDMITLQHMNINLIKKRLTSIEKNMGSESAEDETPSQRRDDTPAPRHNNGISASRSINL